jgi:hypothetical protein
MKKLTSKQIEEGNQLIANFVDLRKLDYGGGERYKYLGRYSTKLFFHQSFEWIMPIWMLVCERSTFTDYLGYKQNDSAIFHNSCYLRITDISEGYDYVNGCYEAKDLFFTQYSTNKYYLNECIFLVVYDFLKFYKNNSHLIK